MNKKIANYLTTFVGVAAFVALSISAEAAEKTKAAKSDETKTAKSDENGAFNKVGTVHKHGVDICMQANIDYDLKPSDDTKTAWLLTTDPKDEAKLKKAVGNPNAWVRVEGTWVKGKMPGCKWVKVSKVTDIKAKPSKKAEKSEKKAEEETKEKTEKKEEKKS